MPFPSEAGVARGKTNGVTLARVLIVIERVDGAGKRTLTTARVPRWSRENRPHLMPF
jgi:hypothetical protein